MTRTGAVAWSVRGLVAVGLALIVPACAKGNTDSSTDGTDNASVVADGGGEAASPCASCHADEACSSGMCVPANTDADGDGVPASTDCDDHDPAIHPGAAEVCNGKDDNCDGKIDEGFDKDNDGVPSCEVGTKPADCDDNDATIHPGATEVCNAKDDDCDGKADNIPAMLNGSLTSPVNAHWTVSGSAFISAGSAQLTTDATTYQTGALWWQGAYMFDHFDVTAMFVIENKANGADGMGFAWVPGTTYTTLGAAGNGYGMGGLGGYGVAIDTFQNTGEPVAPFVTVVNLAAGTPLQLAKSNIPNVRDGLTHTLRVVLEKNATVNGLVSVWVDGTNYLFQFPIPAYAPFAGHWGFTGGTGGAIETHAITDITMSFPDGQGCVP